MTQQGLCSFINVNPSTWSAWSHSEGFSNICEQVSSVIYIQKFQGAAAGLFNPRIIAREPESEMAAHTCALDRATSLLQSERNLSRPRSVSGCVSIFLRTSVGIVAASAPMRAASAMCRG